MPNEHRAQISTEFLIIVSFVTLVIIGLLAVAFYYSATIQDQLRFTNLDRFARSIDSHSEEIYYSGEPSRITIRPYLPTGVQSITVGSNYILFSISTRSGVNVLSYPSAVPLSGSISFNSGVKRIQLIAQDTHVAIIEG